MSFAALKARACGPRACPSREVWEQLERLNVGRLRIASKGIERGRRRARPGGRGRASCAEGMFMAGQVAVLRRPTTTVAALHAAVS